MLPYCGGKQLIGKLIATKMSETKIVLSRKQEINDYLEPFLGFGGVTKHILFDNKHSRYTLSDIDPEIITFWKDIQNGFIPKIRELTKDEYLAIRSKEVRDSQDIFLLYNYAFMGVRNGGYFDYPKSKQETNLKKVIEMSKLLENKVIECKKYTEYTDITNTLIYCDPPYKDTRCHYVKNFNTQEFIDWCIKMSKQGNIVFVSEYQQLHSSFIKVFSKGKEKLYLVSSTNT